MPNTQKPRIKWVNPAQLVVPEERVWSELTEEQEEMLREDIRKHGVKQPIQVREIDGQLVIVDGGHRAVFAAQAGIRKVPVWVLEGDEGDAALQNVVLSVLQGKTRTQDVVRAMKHMIEDLHMTPAQIASNSPFSESYTRTLLRIAEGSPYLLDMLDTGELTVQAAAEIAKIPDPNDQYAVARQCVQARYGITDIRDVVAQVLEQQEKPPEQQTPIEQIEPRGVPCQICGVFCKPGELTTIMLCPACYGALKQAQEEAEDKAEEEAYASSRASYTGEKFDWIGDEYEG